MLKNGIDNPQLLAAMLGGRRAALLSNSAARNRNGENSVQVLKQAGIRLEVLFSPEHGFGADAEAGAHVEDANDNAYTLPCISLYGAHSHIPEEAMQRFDVLVADLPDVGVRYYTYASTLFDAMADCAAAGREVIILDRANPLGSAILEGPLLDTQYASIVGRFPVPVRHGLTIGEYAEMAVHRFGIAPGITLRRLPAEGFTPDSLFPDFNLPWINPSPNLRSFEALTAYPGTCLFEGTNLSEGRGTDAPFLQFGAPWLDVRHILDSVPQTAGIELQETGFTPEASKFQNEKCRGIRLQITDFRVARSFSAVMQLLDAIRQRHPEELTFNAEHFDRLLGSSKWRNRTEDTGALLARARQECTDFQLNP
jgi:uncharacterized protein YbbC (DUF1343 family)